MPAISNTHFDTLKYCFEEDSVNHEEPHSVGQNLFKTIDQIGEIETHLTTKVWRVLLNSGSAFAFVAIVIDRGQFSKLIKK